MTHDTGAGAGGRAAPDPLRDRSAPRWHRLRLGRLRWWIPGDFDPQTLAPLLLRIASALESASLPLLKSGRRKHLYRYEGDPAGSGALLVKRNLYAPGVALWRRLLPSRSRHELRLALHAASAGVATPVPLAAGEVRRLGVLVSCLLVVPVLEGAEDLKRLAHDPSVPVRERRAWAEGLGTLVRRLHEAGIHQEDLALNNFLVRRAPRLALWAIDFERARRKRRVSRRERLWSLAKLERHASGTGAAQRMRWLRAYSGSQSQARALWEPIRRASARLARRDLAHLRRAARGGGRRYRCLERGGWEGWGRRTLEAKLEEEILAGDPQLGAAPLEAEGRFPTARLVGAASAWCWQRDGLSGREARELWARAELLADRRLGPEPLALLRCGRRVRLWLRRQPDAKRLSEGVEPEPAAAALGVLLDRLLAIGRVEGPLDPEVWLVTGERPCRALLLDPLRFTPAPGLGPARHRRARQLARELLLRAGCAAEPA